MSDFATVMRAAERAYAHAENFDEKRKSKALLHALTTATQGNPEFLKAFSLLRRFPVTIEEFIQSEEFLRGTSMEIWPTLVEDIKKMNPDVICGEEPIHEAILGGATGTGKTTLSQATNIYQIYLFTCFRTPQLLFGISANTPIIFTMQSTNVNVTNRAIYKPFREILVQMPYFQRWVEYNRNIQATLELPENNIQIVPAQASVTSIVGQAIAGGILDEVNFMAVIENSKQVAGRRGDGGKFDQAEETYTNVIRRREGRFATRGISMGTLCVLSSTRYKDDFIDRRMSQVTKNKEKNVFLFRKKQYEVNPKFALAANLETFRLLVGNDRYPTRVLETHEVAGKDYPENSQIENVPVNYLSMFHSDPENALRDVVGVATDTISAFITKRHKIVDNVIAGTDLGLKSWIDKEIYELASDEFPSWNEERLPKGAAKDLPRFIHVDLSATKDNCGIAISTLKGMKQILGGEGLVEQAPLVAVEMVVAIKPSAMHPIDIGEIRRWIMQLVQIYKINVAEVTFDGFQSRDSQQVLMKSGVYTREISMDKTLQPYEYLRRAFYEDRVPMVDHALSRQELSRLEINHVLEKVDHPPRGSKDCADAICGSVWACVTSRFNRGGPGFVDDKDKLVRNTTIRERPKGIKK
jgi:hypothetical protein